MGDEQAIRARLAAATPGPWQEWRSDGGQPLVCSSSGNEVASLAWVDDDSNAAFLAHSRTDVETLLALLDAARAEREAAEPCAGCGQPFTPVVDSCLCRTCDAGLRESNERTYQWQRDALARLRAEREAAHAALSALTRVEPLYARYFADDDISILQCVYCQGSEDGDVFLHLPACPWLRAKALVAAPVLAPGREGTQ